MIALVRVPADDLAGPSGAPARPADRPADAEHAGAERPADAPLDPVRVALELPRLTITRMAAELGIPRATLEAYRLGTRRMPAAMRDRLARYLVEHARALEELARLLHRS